MQPLNLALHGAIAPSELAGAWVTEPFAALALGALAVVYGVGLDRVWQRAGSGRGISRDAARCFAAGLALLALSLLSPLHALGETLFAAHMTQHVLLMAVAAPLLVLGQPLLTGLWALPARTRRRVARVLRSPPVTTSWRLLTAPLVAWIVHTLVLWTWHVPALYDASVRLRWVHALQHASFFSAAMLFWWVLLRNLGSRQRAGLGVLYVFTTAVHTAVLGALLTFARAPWYEAYAESTTAWGLTPLEDLQLGGLIMWVPGSLPYLAALLFGVTRWLRDAERPVPHTVTAT